MADEAPRSDGAVPEEAADDSAASSRAVATSVWLTRRYPVALVLALFVILLDRGTKEWAYRALADGPMEIIPGLLSFSLTENFGASFSMFQGAGTALGVAAIGAAVVIMVMLRSVETPAEVVSLALILGGSVGNLVDRVIRGDGVFDGGVIDFIALPNFPHFNVADSAITVGAVLLVWAAIRKSD
jgi:signal peptidase II